MRFDYYNPVRYIFGRGRIAETAACVKAVGSKALLVTTPSNRSAKIAERISGLLRAEGIECVIFDKVMQNPLSTVAEEGGRVARENNCDVVIGLGGGSAMDTAKGIAVMANNGGAIYDYIFGKSFDNVLPIIAITTTAGTGSEVNCTAVFTNPETNDKKGLVNPKIYPRYAIVDSEMMQGSPKNVIAGPGLDALFHAIESYISVKSNPYSEMLSLRAIELIKYNLVKVYENPDDLDGWDNMAFASSLAGMAIGSAGTTVPHALSHPLGGFLDIVHSHGLAAIYKEFMLFTYLGAQGKFAQIAHALGGKTGGMTEKQAAELSVELVEKLMHDVNGHKPLSELGVEEKHIGWLTQNAMTTMRVVLNNNPVVPEEEQIKEIYRRSL